MVNITTIPGLKTIDPVEGLINYIDDIKPYHTKIFEVLTNYVYTDYVNVTMTEIFNLNINSNYIDDVNVTLTETTITETLEFFASASDQSTYVITSVGSNTIGISGNVSNIIMANSVITNNYTSSDPTNFFVINSNYNSITNITTLTLNTNAGIALDNVVASTNPSYAFKYPIQEAIPVGNVTTIDPAVPSRMFTNAVFLVDLNVTQAIQAGSAFTVVGGTPNDGTYYVQYVLFDPLTNVSTVGVTSPSVVSAIGTGYVTNIIILNYPNSGDEYSVTTGYDSPYDSGPYDQQAGYRIIYPGP
jgi:hypothetical protein